MKNPLISVIVPCYNVEDYITKCVDSLVAQTYTNLEILLIDDGSSDRTPDLARQYAEQYDMVSCYRRENGGLSAARNTGLDISKGEFIAFVDSDDWVEPEYIEKLYESISNGNADMAVCGYKQEELSEETVTFDKEDVITAHAAMKILGDIYPKENVLLVIAWNKLYKRALFETIRFPENRIHEDEFCCHRIIGKTDFISVIPDVLYHYRVREGSITAADKSQDLRHLDYLDALSDRIQCVRKSHFEDLLIYMIYSYFEGMKQLLVRYTDETIRVNDLYPFFRRKAARMYLRCVFETDTYQKRDYLKLIISPKRYRDVVLREMGK
ncbi:MAG: glycosyltransferase family 2 protein [Butyrivibrio sp.]|nr:glycosyltransferase family 2 protein [Butyrivibrio sp.]